jgi:hypothetical protein
MKRAVWCVAACAAALSGCQDGVDHPAAFAELERALEASPTGEVVAKVGARALTARELEELWRMRPELNRDEALEALIEQELLAREGVRRRLRDVGLEDARKRGLSRAVLDADVVAGAGEVDEGVVEVFEAAERKQQGHPDGLRASHLLIKGPALQTKEGRGAAVRALERAIGLVPEGASAADLRAAARELEAQGALVEGLETHVDADMRFARRGQTKPLPEGWVPIVSGFVEASERAADAGRLGVPIGPVRTRFGVHLIVVHEVLDAPTLDEDRIEAIARAKAQATHEQVVFDGVVAKLRESHAWSVFPKALLEDAAGGS